MSARLLRLLALPTAAFALVACGSEPSLPEDTGYGPDPLLPPPETSWFPTVTVAPARGWREGEAPEPAPGFTVKSYADDLDHPRWLYVLPNGDVLVAETNAPPRPEDDQGIKAWITNLMMKRAGAGVPSANRITLLRDADQDGHAETRSVFLERLNSPFGMVLIGDRFYVANTDAIVRFPYQAGARSIEARGEKVMDLPAGPLNHHWTKNVIASPDGARLYVTVGSNSNIAENGMEAEERRAAILELDLASGASRLYASGLRNPNGMDFHPQSNVLWTVVNERDELGDHLVPDYMTSVQEGGFYGWPYSYYGQIVDERIEPQRPELVAKAIAPDYALGSHTAALGLVFYRGELLPSRYRNGAFIGQHGSWNRERLSGYRVIFVPFAGGRPAGRHEEILAGFITDDGEARGRPVGVAVDASGALLVADDVGNRIWRIAPDSSRTR